MSSYFTSYFSGSQQSHGTPLSTSSGTSTWSTTLSTRLQGLRKALTSTSEQDDLDDEDCSHVSNVLRAYYTEKGRPFPSWLPPDPKKPSAAPSQQAQYGQFGNMYGGYGNNQSGNTPQAGSRGSGGRGSGLSDLWDSGPSQAAAPAVPQSLRAPRAERPVPQSILQSHGSAGSSGSMIPPSSQSTARPLPSQRAGSYQFAQQTGPAAAGSRDRLRARLQAGGSGRSSPAPSSGSANYGQSAYKTEGNYSSQGGNGAGASPYVSASQPWVGGDDTFNGGYGGDSTYAGRQGNPGLPRGPRPGGPR